MGFAPSVLATPYFLAPRILLAQIYPPQFNIPRIANGSKQPLNPTPSTLCASFPDRRDLNCMGPLVIFLVIRPLDIMWLNAHSESLQDFAQNLSRWQLSKPTSAAKEQEINTFYEQLQQIIHEIPRHGDFDHGREKEMSINRGHLPIERQISSSIIYVINKRWSSNVIN